MVSNITNPQHHLVILGLQLLMIYHILLIKVHLHYHLSLVINMNMDTFNNGDNSYVDNISVYSIISGCTNPLATNYDPLATVDDGSCTYSATCTSPSITGLGVTNIIHNRATFTFDDMNSSTCRVDQLRIKYREVGTTAWSQKNMGSPTGYDPITGICNSTSRTDKLVLGLSANTTWSGR